MENQDTDTMEHVAQEIKEAIATKLNIELPKWYRVIYLNDDITTMEFVIFTLQNYFGHDIEKAMELTNMINNEGQAIVAVLPLEIAEQKGYEVAVLAKQNGFPLKIKLEVDSN